MGFELGHDAARMLSAETEVSSELDSAPRTSYASVHSLMLLQQVPRCSEESQADFLLDKVIPRGKREAHCPQCTETGKTCKERSWIIHVLETITDDIFCIIPLKYVISLSLLETKAK